MVVATRVGLVSRVVSGSMAFDVLNDIGSTVLCAERPQKRSLLERLFGE